ncbi:oligosaccharide flippase family protein [Salinihabitans flavidus]|nr:oligosaccharide flippase family protein [Salinihabitans flavidus]
MMQNFLRGEGLAARAMRSSALTVGGYAGSQAMRLASNLILTRLLFPEAFGTMALVMLVMQGLAMFSDVGTAPAIMQSKRGDDPEFLDTAWTIQVIRGVCLWIATCILAYPAAQFYNTPELVQLLPVAGFSLIIAGFGPTRIHSANRHLILGRVTVIDLCTQAVSLLAAIVFALVTQSVWALVVSGIVSVVVQLALYSRFLPGRSNRLRWEKESAQELVRFGRWIFLSTVAGFILSQGDKLVLGKYLSLQGLGIYNIGYFLASFPLLLGTMVIRRVLIPLYRERPPKESRENFLKFRKLRFLLSAMIFAMLFTLSFLGVGLVDLLYDSRYALAGGIVVLVAAMQVPHIIALTYDQAAVAAGDSDQYFVLAATRAGLTLTGLVLGAQYYGLTGALLGQGAAYLLSYPVVVWLARRQGCWDPFHDAAFAVLGVALAALAIWMNLEAISGLIAMNSPPN